MQRLEIKLKREAAGQAGGGADRPRAKGEGEGRGDVERQDDDVSVKLARFMGSYCQPDGDQKDRLPELAQLVFKAAAKGKVELPGLAEPWTSGQPKRFWKGDLIKCWHRVKGELTYLPPLRSDLGK